MVPEGKSRFHIIQTGSSGFWHPIGSSSSTNGDFAGKSCHGGKYSNNIITGSRRTVGRSIHACNIGNRTYIKRSDCLNNIIMRKFTHIINYNNPSDGWCMRLFNNSLRLILSRHIIPRGYTGGRQHTWFNSLSIISTISASIR